MLEELAQDCANKVKVDGFDYFGNRKALMTMILLQSGKDPINGVINAGALYILCGGKIEEITSEEYLDDYFMTHNFKEEVVGMSQDDIDELEDIFIQSGFGVEND